MHMETASWGFRYPQAAIVQLACCISVSGTTSEITMAFAITELLAALLSSAPLVLAAY